MTSGFQEGDAVPPGRAVPERTLPVPGTVSPELATIIARPPDPAFNVVPPTIAAWKERIARSAAMVAAQLPALRSELGVESEPGTIAGVKVFRLTPRTVPPANQSRILLHFHGGTRVLFPGESGTREAILMAGLAGFRVISVDYRMPPDHPFPATLDDAVAVYGALLKDFPAANIGVFGMSAGGSLTITTLLRAKQLGLPMPGAIAPGTPTVDLTKTGDTSPASGLAVDRFDTAAGGKISYERGSIQVAPDVAAAITKGQSVVVIHGVDYNKDGKYDGDTKSDLDPSLPTEATDPALCGVLSVAPAGGMATGQGGAAGGTNTGMIALGGAALFAAAGTGTLAARRKRVQA